MALPATAAGAHVRLMQALLLLVNVRFAFLFIALCHFVLFRVVCCSAVSRIALNS